MQYPPHFALCSGGAEDAFTEARLHVWERHGMWGERRTKWRTASLPKMSSSGCCTSTRVHKKLGKLRADFRPVQDIMVQLPLRNQEEAFVQEVFWDHSVWQKGLVPKLSNHEIFLMSRYLYAMPWRLGAVTDRDCDHKSFPRRKSCPENSEGNGRQKCWRKAKGPQNTVKPQTAMRCDKGGKVGLQHTYTPAVPGCWSSPFGRQVHCNMWERSWSCIIILGWTQGK